MKKKYKIILISGIFFLLLLVTVFLILNKKISITPIWADHYEVQGIDVSHYQGGVDWNKIQQQGISFAFIKATEGSGMVDRQFAGNWKRAGETNLCIGAYHFFSFDSPAREQAALFQKTVGDLAGKLPPVIDVEYYGDKEQNPPEKEKTVSEIKEMLDILEREYKVKPILYTTYKVYRKYLRDNFEEYPLWIRNVYYKPGFDIGRDWLFWQYSDTGIMEGCHGEEPFTDRNVFAGTREELLLLLVGGPQPQQTADGI